MEATVIIPTHDHADTLLCSVASARAQTVADIEILVIGDGVPPRTREIMGVLTREDSRIRFFDFPKGPRHGETHRAQVLAGARGRCVCYLCDDDLWTATHLERICEALRDADFAHTTELFMPPDGEPPVVNGFEIGHPADREALMNSNFGFGLACGGHTLDAYRRLPHGWHSAPKDVNTDVHMWRQFLDQPWCRAVSVPSPTVLKFLSPWRRGWTLEQRVAELAEWVRRIESPGFAERLAAQAIRALWRQALDVRETTPWVHVSLREPFAPYRLGECIEFAAGCAAPRYLSWGWSDGEAWGRWTDGAEARLTLELDRPPEGELVLEAAVQGFVGPKVPRTEVDVVCNGRRVETWEFEKTEIGIRSVTLREASRRIDLRFQIAGIVRAAQRIETRDQRRIGLGVVWMRLRSSARQSGEGA